MTAARSIFARGIARWLATAAMAGALGACKDPGPQGDGHNHDHDAAFFPSSDAGVDVAADGGGDAYAWVLPKGFPVPVVPADNPMSAAKVELGRHLFYDQRLSLNQTQSCASCHKQAKAFTDGRKTGLGSTGEHHTRGSMSLANIAYATTFTWANPLLQTLEAQAAVPLFGDRPVELGMQGQEAALIERLRAAPRYVPLFAAAYPSDPDAFTVPNVLRAIASFQRTLISGDSPYDRYVHGDATAISAGAKRGEALFNSERLECFHCHVGFNLQDSVNYVGKAFPETTFHNTGLYNIDGQGGYPVPNRGVLELTGRPEDMGRFRVPTLRNIAVTAPYMHDGSIETLSEVLDHYAAAGRTIPSGPNAGNGSASPLKSTLLIGFTLTAQERADVIEFLESLTDTNFLGDRRFADPWE
ncbi:MAG TPA: MbnH family di-heme enzyme [Polyangia bacterium]